jgi:hypothetical protein
MDSVYQLPFQHAKELLRMRKVLMTPSACSFQQTWCSTNFDPCNERRKTDVAMTACSVVAIIFTNAQDETNRLYCVSPSLAFQTVVRFYYPSIYPFSSLPFITYLQHKHAAYHGPR